MSTTTVPLLCKAKENPMTGLTLTDNMTSIGSPKTGGSSTPSYQKFQRQRTYKRRRGANAKPQGTPIEILKLDDLESGPDVQINIENCMFLASYNWTKAREPTVFVPGAPALWTAPTLPVTIPKDNGKARIDQNSDRVTAPSFAPFFAALLTMQPSYSLLPISLVTDRNCLRKLFDFASGHSGENWRIEVALVQETLFLTRWEKSQVRIITGSFNSGYGHEFENAFLKFEEGLEDSCAHHRVAEYEIGGMKWVVRFEVDGYFEGGPGKEGPTTDGVSLLLPEISAAVEALSLEPDSKPSILEGVTVIQKGHLVSPASIIEVKCKKTTGKSQLGKTTPQCWFSQTKHVFVGRHKDGFVDKVNKVEMSSIFEDWEKTHQDKLRKLTALIKKIREVSRQANDGRCCLFYDYRERPRVLRVFKSNDKRLELSAEVKERFWEGRVGDSAV